MSERAAADHVRRWDANYARGRANRYPYEGVVGFVLRRFGAGDRASVRVLDLGCGGGNHLRFLQNEGFDHYGVDGSQNAVDLSKAAIGGDPEDRVRRSDFRSLPFPAAWFHAVIDRQALGHNRWSDVPLIVREIERVLRPAGAYYGNVFGRGTDDLRLGAHLGDGDWADFQGGLFRDSHLVHAFTLDEVERTFERFDIVRLVRHERTVVKGGNGTVEGFEIEAIRRAA